MKLLVQLMVLAFAVSGCTSDRTDSGPYSSPANRVDQQVESDEYNTNPVGEEGFEESGRPMDQTAE